MKKFVLFLAILAMVLAPFARAQYYEEEKVELDRCKVCRYVAKTLVETVGNNKNREYVRNAVLRVCTKVPTQLEQQCKTIVSGYADTLVDIILGKTKITLDEFCTKRFCGARNFVVPEPEDFAAMDFVEEQKIELNKCKVCHVVAEKLVESIGSDKNRQRVEQAVLRVCYKVPQQFQQQCKTIVSGYAETLVDIILGKTKITLDQFCAKRFCSVRNFVVAEPEDFAPQNFVEAMDFNGLNTGDEESFGAAEAAESAIDLDTVLTCGVCKQVTEYAREYIGENFDSARIVDGLKHGCRKLRTRFDQKICLNFVSAFGEKIVEKVKEKGLAALDTLCVDANLCPKPATVVVEAPVSEEVEEDEVAVNDYGVESFATAADSMACTVCQQLAEKAKGIATDKGPEYIIQFLHNTCDRLESLSGVCHVLVNVSGKKIADYLIKHGSNSIDKLCPAIGLCPKTKEFSAFSAAATTTVVAVVEQEYFPYLEGGSVGCEVCKRVMAIAGDYIKDKQDPNAILNGLHKACDSLGGVASTICNAAVAQFGNQIVDWIRDNTDKALDGACPAIGLCPKTMEETTEENMFFSGNEFTASPAMAVSEEEMYINEFTASPALVEEFVAEGEDFVIPANKNVCFACEFAVSKLAEYIKENRVTPDDLAKRLMGVCGRMPSEYKSICEAIVVLKGREIIKNVLDGISSGEICTTIKAC